MRQTIDRIVSGGFRAAAILFYLGAIALALVMLSGLAEAAIELVVGRDSIDTLTTVLVMLAWPALVLMAAFAFDRLARLAKSS